MTRIRRIAADGMLRTLSATIRYTRVIRVLFHTTNSHIAQKCPRLPPMTNRCQMA